MSFPRSRSKQVPTDVDKESRSTEQDIFTGLLTDSGSKSADAKPDHVTCPSEKSTVDLGSESPVIFEPNVEATLSIGESLVTCGRTESGHSISLYFKTSSCSGKPIYPALPTFRLTIPDSKPSNSIFLEQRDEEAIDTKYSQSCSLLCVQPFGGISSHDCLHLEDRVFGQLFGRDALLLASPVVLLGCSTGWIYFFPLAFSPSVNSHSEPTSSSSAHTSGNDRKHITFTPQILYDLQQDLSGIHLANLPLPSERKDNTESRNAGHKSMCSSKGTSAESCNAVIFVGSRDKVVVAVENRSQEATESGVSFTEYSVPGPIICSCMTSKGDVLVHSTGREIFVTKLYPESPSASSGHLPQGVSAVLNPKCIMIPFVCAIHCSLKPQRHRSEAGTDGRDQVLALTFKGRLLAFPLLSPEEEPGELPMSPLFNLAPNVAAKKVKDALVNIEEVCTQLSKVNLIIKAENEILKELNIAISIVCDIIGNAPDGFGFLKSELQPESSRTLSPIVCTFSPVVKSFDSVSDRSIILQCRVTNQGNWLLSGHWSLLVQLHGCKQWLGSGKNQCIAVNHSVSLGMFQPGSSTELNIPLDENLDVMSSVSVEAFLLCDLHSLLAGAQPDLFRSTSSLQNVSDIVVPIARKVFDALHFLRPHSVHGGRGCATMSAALNELVDTLKILNSVPRRLNLQDEGSAASKAPFSISSAPGQSQSSSLQLSQDCLDHMVGIVQDSLKDSLKSHGISELPTEAAVFLFLLADSNLTPQQVGRNCSLVTLATVNCEPITMHVRDVGGSPVFPRTNESSATMSGVELIIKAPSGQLLSCVHEAVIKRLEVKLG